MSRLLIVTPAALQPERAAGDARLSVLGNGLSARGHEVTWALPGDVSAQLLEISFDAVLAMFWRTAAACIGGLRRYRPGTPLIIDTVDLHTTRLESAAALGLATQAEVEEERTGELATYAQADALLMCSDDDAESLQALLPRPPAMTVVPIPATPRPRSEATREQIALFIGGFAHKPNQDGLLWFLEHCWPAVHAIHSQAQLEIVGAGLPADFPLPAGVQYLGAVDNLDPLYNTAMVSIAPLRFGAGMKGKVADALARGLPVVTTSFGAQGFGKNPPGLSVTESAEEFAAALTALFHNPTNAHTQGLAGQKYVATLCSPERLIDLTETAIETVIAQCKAAHTKPNLTAALWRGAAKLSGGRR